VAGSIDAIVAAEVPEVAEHAVYVQYGSGLSCPPGWINFDVSPLLRLQRLPVIGALFKRGLTVFPDGVRFGDIVSGLPIADATVDGVYASHVLEHLSHEDFWKALHNTYRLLKPGGRFRLIVPDLEARARGYLQRLDRGGQNANDWFVEVLGMGARQRARGVGGAIRAAVGNSAHLWMWDERSLRAALEQVGFVHVRRCQFNDSADQAFRAVEDRVRFRDEHHAIDECAMEAERPDDGTA
jgi:SAM-dependent methyltransferase